MAKVLWRASVEAPTSPEEPPVGRTVAPRRRSLGALRTPLIVCLIVVAGAGLAFAYDRATAGHLFPGTRIGGVGVGSHSVADAEAALNETLVRPLQTEPITLESPGQTQRVNAWAIGVRVDVDRAVDAVYAEQRSASIVTRVWRRVFGDERRHPLQSTLSPPRLQAFLGTAAQRIDRPVRDATVELNGSGLTVFPHQVGRRLDVAKAAEQVVTGLRAGQRTIQLPVQLTEPAFRSEAFRKVIFVRTGSNRLDLYVDHRHARSFPVATGTPGYPTPHGQFSVTLKRRNPTWVNPYAEWSMNMPARIGPGPDNPLGTRALNISASGIRIHGTPYADTIGGPASHGCIRMYMNDAEQLFDLVDVGTPVIILGS